MKTLLSILLAVCTFVVGFFAFRFWFQEDILALIVMMSILSHELAHAFSGVIRGVKVVSMFFVPFLGAAVAFDAKSRKMANDFSEALISISGPLANFMLVLVGLVILKDNPNNKYVLALISMNMSLGFFNLIPLKFLDGGHFTAAIFDTLNEEEDELFAVIIRTLSTVLGIVRAAITGFTPVYIIILLSIIKRSREDNPADAYKTSAMTKPQAVTLIVLYILLLFGGFIGEGLVPNWAKMFNIWPN